VSKYVHPVTLKAALQVASDLLPEDRRELVEGHGIDPLEYFIIMSQESSTVHFTAPNGKTAGMAGVNSDGQVWMLCTSVIRDYPVTFAKEAKRFIDGRSEELLWNVVDKRNKLHLKLLKFLGFKFLQEISFGPNQLTFIEFCRVRRKQRKTSSSH
tara:strand:+ start:1327 stop:1791 length:465 start_codon:yes stop_codon:yes gene_type:complete